MTYFSSAGNDGHLSYENTTPAFTVAGSGTQSNEKLLNLRSRAALNEHDDATAEHSATLPGRVHLSGGRMGSNPDVTGSPNSGGATSAIDICIQGAGADQVTDNNSFPNSTQHSLHPVQRLHKRSITSFLIIGNPARHTAYTGPR